MSLYINTNPLSLIVQNRMKDNEVNLTRAAERLSSGKRINSSKDDAAGQAIANRFTSSINGFTQASRNAGDGISMAQIAETGVANINTYLQEIRSLTIQAKNSTNSDKDLNSIQADIELKLSEINRISSTTKFNDIELLTGYNTKQLQVGSEDGETISLSLQKIDTSTLGLNGYSVCNNAVKVGIALTEIGDGSATPKAVTLDAAATSLTTTHGEPVSADKLSLHNLQDNNGKATENYVVKFGNDYYAASVDKDTGKVTLNTVNVKYSDQDNGVSSAEKVNALIKVSATSDGINTAYTEVNGRKYEVNDGLKNGGATTTQVSADIALSGTQATKEFQGTASANPIKAIDEAIQKVISLSGDLGSTLKRLEGVISRLDSTVIDFSQARSRVEDADYAIESSNLTKAQIFAQVTSSLLPYFNKLSEQAVRGLVQNLT